MGKKVNEDKFPNVNGNLGLMMQTIQAMDKISAGGSTLADAYEMVRILEEVDVVSKSEVRHLQDALYNLRSISEALAQAVDDLGQRISEGEMENDVLENLVEEQEKAKEKEEEVTEDGYRIHDTSKEDFAKWLEEQLKGGKD